ncbi:hypothetical protein FRB94_006425 [Tulasnella sp. JGI-2019a]|nr:hypothetical protein FRB93_006199 [Tulasnella sp. JGI-2019a]KAG8999184.1 hypothetical protein FRB94_006425 [Tulasnella sp. JGI-2019a]
MARSIHELPEEVLGMVFFEFIEQEESQQMRQHSSPHLLISVCRLWKEVAEAHSEIWSRIDVDFGKHFSAVIRNKIQKAKRSPLGLYIHCSHSRTYSPAALTRDVLALYDQIKDLRWRALFIFDPRWLEPFQIIFQHMIDNPQTCRITSFQLGGTSFVSYNNGVAFALLQEALRQHLSVTRLVMEAALLEPSHPLLQVVPYLQLTRAHDATNVLDCVRKASSLRSLRLDHLWGGPERHNLTLTYTLPKLEHLDLRVCRQFPKLLILSLDLPSIQRLTFKVVECKVKDGDEQLKSLFWTVPWLQQLRSLTLEEVEIPEETIFFALRRLPLLMDLTLTSRARVSCKTTKTLSLPPEGRRGWMSPLLEVITFGECPRLSESDVMALVEARVCDVPHTAPASAITEDQPPPSRLRKVIWQGRDMAQRG